MDVLSRAKHCALTHDDLSFIEAGGYGKRGKNWQHYRDAPYFQERTTWRYAQESLPLHLLHPFIRKDVANFFENPDQVLRDTAREIEARLRKHIPACKGPKPWEKAFKGQKAPLVCLHLTERERDARMTLFEGAFSTIRNPRAHRTDVPDDYVFEELLLLSMLMGFLDEAEPSQTDNHSGGSAACSIASGGGCS